MTFRLSKYGKNFKKAVAASAWQQLNQKIALEFDNQMDAVVYDWPRQTRTKGGSPVVKGSPRKITDTGDLKDSRTLRFSEDGFTAVHRWDANHAATVLLGGTNKNGTFQPPRDWITPVLMRELS